MKNYIYLLLLTATCIFKTAKAQEIIRSDSITFREITKVFNTSINMQVHFYNSGRPFRILQSSNDDIIIKAKVYTKNIMQYSDDDLFKMLSIWHEPETSTIYVFSVGPNKTLSTNAGAAGGSPSFEAYSNYLAADKKIKTFIQNKKKSPSYISQDAAFEIYLPAHIQLIVENHFSPVLFKNNIRQATVFLQSSVMDARNIDTLKLTSKLSQVKTGNIIFGHLNTDNDRLFFGDFDSIYLQSTSSIIEIGNGNKLNLVSQRDKVFIESVNKITVNKKFGEIRLGTLTNQFLFNGESADISIRNIAETVQKVEIINSWANIKLPLVKLSSYNLHFIGFSTVFADFDFNYKKIVPDDIDKRYFTVYKGDGSKKITLNCPKCLVDFK